MSERTQMLKKKLVSMAYMAKKFESGGGFKSDAVVKPEFNPGVSLCLERAKLVTESYKVTEGQPMVIRRAKALAHTLENMTVYISEGELIVGNMTSKLNSVSLFPELSIDWVTESLNDGYRSLLDERGREEYKEIAKYWKGKTIADITWALIPKELMGHVDWNGVGWYSCFYGGKPSPSLNIEKLLRLGLNGIRDQVEQRLEELNAGTLPAREYVEQRNNLEAMLVVLGAAINFGRRYATLARDLALGERDAKRKQELNRIAEVCDWVPGNPPRTLHEAIESFYLSTIIAKQIEANGQGLGNRFDVLMNPYYQRDIKERRISRDEARELMECLYVKLSEWGFFRPISSAQMGGGVSVVKDLTIGGITPEGDDATNEFSFIMLDAAQSVKAPEPTIALRYHPKISPELISKAIDVVRTGIGYPAFYNDSAFIPFLLDKGIPLDEAKDYAIVQCVIPVIPGKNYDASRHPACVINLGKCLELALYRGKDKDKYTGKQLGPKTPDPKAFTCIEDVIDAFLVQIRYVAEIVTAIDRITQVIREQYLQHPFNSTLLDGCIEMGKDCTSWEYNDYANVLVAGATNVANSLAAIQKFVFDDKSITMEELVEACRTNFDGKEELRLRLVNGAPKFGNDDDYVDRFARAVHVRANAEFMKLKTNFGHRYTLDGSIVAGYFGLSKACGALPDGKKDSESLSDAVISPAAGTDKKGPSAVLKSVSKVPPTYNHLLNQKFLPQYLEGENKKVFAQYLKTWADLGIFHIQFNVVSKDTLLDAQCNPQNYSDLVVRVAGFSAYFVDLAKGLQDDIIARAAQSF